MPLPRNAGPAGAAAERAGCQLIETRCGWLQAYRPASVSGTLDLNICAGGHGMGGRFGEAPPKVLVLQAERRGGFGRDERVLSAVKAALGPHELGYEPIDRRQRRRRRSGRRRWSNEVG